MFKFFSTKKRLFEKEMKTDSQILTKLDRIIELLEQNQKENNEKKIHIDHVQIDHLENIVFKLDNLEIDELSGKLIIGNNIGSNGDLSDSHIFKMDKEKVKMDSRSEASNLQPNISKTAKGFCLKNNFK
ncbi:MULTISPECIES: hypothetical protein [Bacillaceae]|uniref:hypothetical protein n=1 Tax=Bacillaceae TaxID=186817 RepID=UPI002FFDBF74